MNAHRARAGSNPSAVHDRHFAASIGNQYYTVQYITSADSHPFPVRIQYCLQFPVTATRSISFLISSENSVLLIQYRTSTAVLLIQLSVLLIQYSSTAHSVLLLDLVLYSTDQASSLFWISTNIASSGFFHGRDRASFIASCGGI